MPDDPIQLPAPLLAKSGSDALKALLELAGSPTHWRSTREIARAQALPEPMLEQLLLRLRRAGLVVARRGRMGGYRLAQPPEAIRVACVLAAVQGPHPDRDARAAVAAVPVPGDPPAAAELAAADQVTQALEQRLQRAVRRALQDLSLEELLFDLRSAEACRDSEAGLLLG